jgi:hypothetical protein
VYPPGRPLICALISNRLDALYVPQENYLLVDVDSVLALKKTALFVVQI